MEKPEAEYFHNVTAALRAHGVCQPTLVLDLTRLDHNTEAAMSVVRNGYNLRIVTKSLPSPPLLSHIMEKAGTKRLMCFHIPFLLELTRTFPSADILLGKPMPASAVKWFYEQQRPAGNSFDPAKSLHWLVDSLERLKDYETIALSLGLDLQINLEVDIGLHRGGFSYQSHKEFGEALDYIHNSSCLHLSGLMGYDVFITHVPQILCGKQKCIEAAHTRYRQFRGMVEAKFTPEDVAGMNFNTGGSTTYPLYDQAGPANEISMASALIQPTDFDRKVLSHHQPAAFIAAPVLKVIDKPQIPMLPRLSKVLRMTGQVPHKACFLYGGNWLAEPYYPSGTKCSSLFGRSSNQEMYELPRDSNLKVDDYVFFRPTQSEAVLLQFGDIAAFDGTNIVDRWPVLGQTHKEQEAGLCSLS
ncbi:hypothetical protein PsAD2_01677 [Pseudovibrio axinellae]|uniref:Alanine racemase N-terminal domain-containing protein n=1 Tax=Pseudovibrio axinellae TaxID=989403 RepID=A0A165ZFZ3_9HYPH|nr:alanine racemase [Pseudovibrio axinellae]KZL19855.1 hypothetical protein PsAD2_01677 [Pseudovibrio axinellae]SER39082.1 D-serine deaminase, pyridoxal phosphate-dependent [Pseudovibrio axinellae]